MPSPIAGFPDQTLQLLQAERLAIAIHEPRGIADDRSNLLLMRGQIGPRRWRLAPRHIGDPVGAQALDDARELRPAEVLADEGFEGPPCEGEKRLRHERERRRRPLDVENDRVEAARAEVERHTDAGGAIGRIYAGPKHTGWNSRSVPLCV